MRRVVAVPRHVAVTLSHADGRVNRRRPGTLGNVFGRRPAQRAFRPRAHGAVEPWWPAQSAFSRRPIARAAVSSATRDRAFSIVAQLPAPER